MNNSKLLIAYEGTSYSGWQIQPNSVSIQELIQKALHKVLREEVKLIGSGRTDAGVHALGQVAHFKSEKSVDYRKLLYALNGMLPKDIRILSCEEAPLSFHSQLSAKSKIYHYHLWLDDVMDPTKRHFVHHVRARLDLSQVKEGALLFIGKHDFSAFANSNHEGSASINPVRTLSRLDVIPQVGGARLEFEADGFLYKMVRNIVGTLLDLGTNKVDLAWIQEVFASKDRRCAGKAAPAQGLFLMHVKYD